MMAPQHSSLQLTLEQVVASVSLVLLRKRAYELSARALVTD